MSKQRNRKVEMIICPACDGFGKKSTEVFADDEFQREHEYPCADCGSSGVLLKVSFTVLAIPENIHKFRTFENNRLAGRYIVLED